MADSFTCRIVTPSEATFEGQASYVSFPAWDGQHGMLAGQSPMLTRLGVGTLRIDLASGASEQFLVDGGFAQVQGETLTILTEAATPAAEITRAEADQEWNAVSERVGQPGEDMRQVEHDQQVALAKRHLATK